MQELRSHVLNHALCRRTVIYLCFLYEFSNQVTESAYRVQDHVPKSVKDPTTPSFTLEILIPSETVLLLKGPFKSLKRPLMGFKKFIPITLLVRGTSRWIPVNSKSFQHYEKSRATLTSKRHTPISPICHTSGENLHNNLQPCFETKTLPTSK